MATIILPGNIVPEVLIGKENYERWSGCIKNYLLAQDLWDIIETTTEPPKPEDGVVEFKAWRKRNAATLHAIQISCGMDTQSHIKDTSSAKILWDALANMYKQPAQGVGNSSSSTGNNFHNTRFIPEYAKLYDALQKDNRDIADDFITQHPDSERAKITHLGQTALHVAVLARNQEMAAWLVKEKMRKEDLEIQDNKGLTALAQTSRGHDPDLQLVKLMIEKNPKLVTIRNNLGQTALHIAVLAHNEELVKLLVEEKMSKENLEIRDNKGFTALALTIIHGYGPNSQPVKLMMEKNTKLVTIGNNLGQTALHVAILAQKKEIVKWLVEEKISKEDLEIRDNEGLTALDLAIIHGYELQLVKLMTEMSLKLVTVGKNQGLEIPIVLALRHERQELANHFYELTPFDQLQPEIGATVVTKAIHTGNYDLASRLIESSPDLAFTRDTDNVFPVSVFFGVTSLLRSTWELLQAESRWTQLRQMVYTFLHISSPRENIFKYYLENRKKPGEEDGTMGSGSQHSTDQIQKQYDRLLFAMLDSIGWVTEDEMGIESGVVQAIFGAVRAGMVGFIIDFVMYGRTDIFYQARDGKRRNVLMSAVQHRQPVIFGLIYDSLKEAKATVLSGRDKEGNNILHVAGTLIEFSPLDDHITGAALKMQTELQWFKEVEDLCNPMYRNERNYDGLTPKQVFTQTHKELMKEGERWMKDTSTSCTVIGALIVTIMFAAAFAVPGGNNQNTGFPIFLNRKLFKIFIIADSLSLFSSSISVLMFLGILTLRYEEKHFLKSLPTKMIIGLSTLFFSIATMMIAFSCAILMMMRGESWIVIPLIGLASVPVSMYVFVQSRVLVDVIATTYRSGTISRKIKSGREEYKFISTIVNDG